MKAAGEYPLTMVEEGKSVKLCNIKAGRCLRCRLASMGLIAGREIEILRNTTNGPFVIRVGDSCLALGKGIGHQIMVK